MIAIDSSAVVAILRGEPEAADFTGLLDSTNDVVMSAVSLVETHMVVSGRRAGAEQQEIDALVSSLGIVVAEVTVEQAYLAVSAFLRYGRGRHRAALNLGDCFSYALARSKDIPLLFKGEDFARTDVAAAWQR